MLVYDGDCGFCTRTARWVAARAPGVEVVAWQALGDPSRVGLTPADVERSAWWIDTDGNGAGGDGGRRFGDHEAIAHALVAVGGGWRWAGRALLAPPLRWMGRPLYRVVARNRHRLPGGTDACRLPDRTPAAPRPGGGSVAPPDGHEDGGGDATG